MRVILLALGFLSYASPTLAWDYYVNNLLGDDRQNGLAEEPDVVDGPVATIGQALKIAAPGDHIYVANTGEPYREQVSLSGCNPRGRDDRPLVISGNGATLDGTVAAAYGAWRHVRGDVFAMRPRRLTYQQLFLQGKPLDRVHLVSLHGIDTTLEPLHWALGQGHIYLRVEQGHLPHLYDLRHAGLQTGITLHNTHNVVIEDFVVQGFQQDGLNAHELVKDCVLRRIECRANGRCGLSAGGVSRVRVEQSNFYDNGRWQVRAEQQAQIDLEQCDVAASEQSLKYGLAGGRLTVDGQLVTSGDESARSHDSMR
ncbi:MAG: right-handed parallel beta-helix repeat-containing protein [Planctomycetales bacterium]|nr:right-handed parallel beta-helix repeat-containing protein [Planctomycetales bacterium]